jgi:predicted peroxiredoxin
MGHLLVHLTSGPEDPTRAALGFLIAAQAAQDGHRVSLFVGLEAVGLLRDPVLDSLQGFGTGSLRESYDAFVEHGGRIYVSQKSSKVRGVTDVTLEGHPAEFILPERLVALTFEADRVLCY